MIISKSIWRGQARWPLEPYLKGTYRLGVPFGDRNLRRLDETIFWRAGEGFGATTRFDLERLLAEDFLVRWTGSGTFTYRILPAIV